MKIEVDLSCVVSNCAKSVRTAAEQFSRSVIDERLTALRRIENIYLSVIIDFNVELIIYLLLIRHSL